jgi:hypothetical protein
MAPNPADAARTRTPWRVVHVAAPPATVPFSFTTGMGRLRDHADVVVFDMPAPSARRYLDALGARVRAGATLRPGQTLDGLHEHFRFGLVEVVDRAFLVDLGRWDLPRWRDPARPLLQLVWPDLCGTLPWEPGCDLAAGGLRQPLLGTWCRGRDARRD